jgi:hypothetical protein
MAEELTPAEIDRIEPVETPVGFTFFQQARIQQLLEAEDPFTIARQGDPKRYAFIGVKFIEAAVGEIDCEDALELDMLLGRMLKNSARTSH